MALNHYLSQCFPGLYRHITSLGHKEVNMADEISQRVINELKNETELIFNMTWRLHLFVDHSCANIIEWFINSTMHKSISVNASSCFVNYNHCSDCSSQNRMMHWHWSINAFASIEAQHEFPHVRWVPYECEIQIFPLLNCSFTNMYVSKNQHLNVAGLGVYQVEIYTENTHVCIYYTCKDAMHISKCKQTMHIFCI